MVSTSVLRIIIVVALSAHGIAHAIALAGLIGQGAGGASASTSVVRTWLMPGIGPNWAAVLAIPFWLVATVGFLLAALSVWGVLAPDAPWRQIAVGSAMVSIAGLGLFAGTWPGSRNGFQNLLDIGVAMTMDVAILVTQLWLHWPEQALLGR